MSESPKIPKTLEDLKLYPWTPERSIAAQTIGILYPNLGRKGRNQLARTNVYPGAVNDVCIFVYLSTLPDELTVSEMSEPERAKVKLTVEEAERAAEESFNAARRLGIERGIDKRATDQFWDAYGLFWDTMKEAERVATKPKDQQGDEDEEHPNG